MSIAHTGRLCLLAPPAPHRTPFTAHLAQLIARFYRLDPHPIARFYAHPSTALETRRILTGKLHAPISRATHALGAATA